MIANVSAAENFVGLSLSSVRRSLRAQLAEAGIKDPDYESRLMVQMALGIDAAGYVLQENRKLSDEEAHHLEKIVGRRLSYEPLSRIEGLRRFYGRKFFINSSVLDPRPETEILIDVVLEISKSYGEKKWPRSILDVGTGSGCLLITLLATFPFARGVGTDVSSSALEIARINARHQNVEERVSFEQGPALQGIKETFDLLISNPPYIRSGQLPNLEPEVRNFDPHSALDGGEDGLDVYRQIASQLTQVVPSGWAVFEFGFDQALAVADLLQKQLKGRIQSLFIRDDLSGLARCVAVQTHNS